MTEIKTILLAEDNPRDRELATEALSEHNLVNEIAAVEDGVEALAYLRKEGKYKGRTGGLPAVLLLDIKMPRMDGIETLEAIRNDAKLKTLPVVMLTSSREDVDLDRCYALGANAYVVKPVEFEDLLEVVKHLGFFWVMCNEQPRRE